MALQVNPYAGQASTATINPFQQRGEDQTRRTEERDDSASRAETRAAGTSSAESQKSAPVKTSARDSDDDRGETRSSQQRGSLVDLSV
ncbi:MAG: hypothetical protein HYU57_01750 [Micavibrio aeruginosavorus]|nr:hypothetical protein [Micavibrio aeruginosavorus]